VKCKSLKSLNLTNGYPNKNNNNKNNNNNNKVKSKPLELFELAQKRSFPPLCFEATNLNCKLLGKRTEGRQCRVCFEHLRILNFAPEFSICCGACLHAYC
jgi:hypothetical protein